jgi:hypothetical protein
MEIIPRNKSENNGWIGPKKYEFREPESHGGGRDL